MGHDMWLNHPMRVTLSALLLVALASCAQESFLHHDDTQPNFTDAFPLPEQMSDDVYAPEPELSPQDQGTPAGPCTDVEDGEWCDGHQLVACTGGLEAGRVDCVYGCIPVAPAAHECKDPPPPGFCQQRADGSWCAGDKKISCEDGHTALDELCEFGCVEQAANSAQCKPGPVGFCSDKSNGNWCKAGSLVTCLDKVQLDTSDCNYGCDSSLPGGAQECVSKPEEEFCQGKLNGMWCHDDNTLVKCKDGKITEETPCLNGCVSMPLGTPDECAGLDGEFCVPLPSKMSPSPPTGACNWMDWKLSPDGFYLVSQFGTSADDSTWGNGTSCGFLQGHYNYHECIYSNQSGCVGNDYEIPWVQGDVDYNHGEMMDVISANLNGDVPVPEYMYIADAQRFGCGALLRVTNTENGRCVVVYTEDGGPGSKYEKAEYGGRRIVDASPGVVKYLQCNKIGWKSSTLLYVEWSLDGDFPGMKCSPCESTPAKQGSEQMMPPFDVNHMMGTPCE